MYVGFVISCAREKSNKWVHPVKIPYQVWMVQHPSWYSYAEKIKSKCPGYCRINATRQASFFRLWLISTVKSFKTLLLGQTVKQTLGKEWGSLSICFLLFSSLSVFSLGSGALFWFENRRIESRLKLTYPDDNTAFCHLGCKGTRPVICSQWFSLCRSPKNSEQT